MMKIHNAFIGMVLMLVSASLQAEMINIDNARAQELIEAGVPVIDVRRDDEWHKTGVLKDSKLLTFFDKQGRYDAMKWLEQLKETIDTSEPMILICHSGGRTELLGKWLGKQFDTVYNVEDGIMQWLEEKRPTVKP